MSGLDAVATPAALVDVARLDRNVARMQRRAVELGVALRPHAKTAKCREVTRAQLAAGARGITVSTLREAEFFLADGVTDILYAVGIAEVKLPRVLALRRQGCDLKVITDNAATAARLAAFSAAHGLRGADRLECWLEVDTDGHRAGLHPEGDELLAAARLLHDGGVVLGGVMTHAGSSYDLVGDDALAGCAERERAGVVHAAERLRAAGLPCPVVSVGSTPTVLAARSLAGVTEARAGVYTFFDLVMANIGVCTLDEIALGVLATVIGHQPAKGWVLVDAGWMALSRDRGTARQATDYGYGQVCDEQGAPLPGWTVVAANQEHGIVAHAGSAVPDVVARFPVGTRLRILPNHACATAAQFGGYHALGADGTSAWWERVNGW